MDAFGKVSGISFQSMGLGNDFMKQESGSSSKFMRRNG